MLLKQFLPSNLTHTPLRCFSHPQWVWKTRQYFKPTWFDNVNHNHERRWDSKQKRFMQYTQDPLWFDYDRIYLNGGILPYLEQVRYNQRGGNIPVLKRAYILYHMAIQKIHDPEFFMLMEDGL